MDVAWTAWVQVVGDERRQREMCKDARDMGRSEVPCPVLIVTTISKLGCLGRPQDTYVGYGHALPAPGKAGETDLHSVLALQQL